MTDRQDELGRILSTLLKEETEAMEVDTNRAAGRLERELTKSNRRRIFTVAAAAGAVAATVVVGLVLWNQTDSPPAPGPSDRGNDSDASEAPYFLDLSSGETTPLPEGLVPDSTLGLRHSYAPDGTQVALECPVVACSGHDRLEVVHADGTVTVVPVPDGLDATTLAWSRDGSKLVYRLHRGADLGDLYVSDLTDGDSTKVAELGLEVAYWIDLRADFSPDGETVVFHRPRTASSATKLDLWTVPASGGEPTLVQRNAAQPKYMADGQIAFVRPGSNSLVGRVIDVAIAGGSPHTLVELPEEVVDWQLSPDDKRLLTSLSDGPVLIDVATGEASDLDFGGQWAGNDRLIVEPQAP